MSNLPASEMTATAGVESVVRPIARQEVASLCGLVLRRLQDEHPTRSAEHNVAVDAVHAELSRIFGELLAEFGGGGAGPGDDAA